MARYRVSSEVYGKLYGDTEHDSRRDADAKAKALRTHNTDLRIDGAEVGVYTDDGDCLKAWRFKGTPGGGRWEVQ